MFTTFRNDLDSLSVKRTGPSSSFSACKYCRSKKIKCSGESTGCQTCTLQSQTCEYAGPVRKKPGNMKGRGVTTSGKKPIKTLPSLPTAAGSTHWSGRLPSIVSSSSGMEQESTRIEPLETQTPGAQWDDNQWAADCAWESSEDQEIDSSLTLDNDISGLFGYSTEAFYVDASVGLPMDNHDSADSNFTFCSPVPHSSPASWESEVFPLHTVSDEARVETVCGTRDVISQSPLPHVPGNGVGVTTDTVVSPPCTCLAAGLALLEELILEERAAAEAPIGNLLHTRKKSMTTCKSLLNCSCKKGSSYVMLLIEICRRVILSYVNLARKLKEATKRVKPSELNNIHECDDIGVGNMGSNVDVSQGPRLFSSVPDPLQTTMSSLMNDYAVTPEEELCVLASLASLQLKKWHEVLHAVSQQCLSQGLQTHLAMVSDLKGDLQVQQNNMKM